ncbi:MAG: leucine-rich repeat domain-containing protein, partial [Parabacteroides gordonii]|nr:leucine-rich repeat domain-containing protein [Parabacteroides gordonii]
MYKNKTFGSDATVASLTITNGVTKIIDGVFLGCENLTSVNIPATVTSIGKNALRFTASLTAITIPASITEIKAGVFQYSSLASVTFEGEAPTIAADAFLECNNLSKIIVPTGKKDAYQGAVGDGLKEKVVEGTAIENEGSSTVVGGILIGDGSAVASDVTVKGDVTFENVKTLEAKVEDSQISTLTLTGNNELGDITVESNGSLTLE